jgi:hypothetical protein
MKLSEEIIREFYLEEDIQEDIERVKSNLYYFEWARQQISIIEGELKKLNYHAFSIDMPFPSALSEYIDSSKQKIINLSSDIKFEAQNNYPDLAPKVIQEAKNINDQIIDGQPEFMKKVFAAIGTAAYFAAQNYVLESTKKFMAEAPSDVNKDLMKAWTDSYNKSYEWETKNKLKKY